MIQSYLQLKESISHFKSTLEREQGQIQKIYSDAHFVSLTTRYKGRTLYLYLGRGKGYEGFWIKKKPIPSEIRKKDRFLDYLRKHLRGHRITKIEIDDFERIIWIHLKNENCLGLYWRGRLCYFAHVNSEKEVFRSWSGKDKIETLCSSEVFAGLYEEKKLTKASGKKIGFDLDDYFQNEMKEVVENKKVKKLKRKIKNIESDFKKVQKWEALYSLITSDDTSWFTREKKKINDWSFDFRIIDNIFLAKNIVFNKIKNLKKAEVYLRERLEKEKQKLEMLESQTSFSSTSRTVEPVWQKRKNKLTESKKEAISILTFSYQGFVIGVGRSAQENDFLRNTWASKSDTWFHADGNRSCHIIVKEIEAERNGNSENFLKLFQLVGSIIIDYSSLGTMEIDLVYCLVKNLKSLKGKAGAVHFKKEKRLRVGYDKSWRKIVSQIS